MKQLQLTSQILVLILFSTFSGLALGSTCDELSLSSFDLPIGTAELPGAMLIIETSKLKCRSSIGYANMQFNIPMENGFHFPIASNTKMFTAVTIVQLIEEGKIKLEDKAENYFPETVFTLTRSIQNISDVTVLDLLRHSSGITDYLSQPALVDSTVQDPMNERHQAPVHQERIQKIAELLNISPTLLSNNRTFLQLTWLDHPTLQNLNDPDFILGYAVIHGTFDQPTFPPGTNASYSNTNYLLLGKILEYIERKPIEQIFRSRIIEPLDMKSTFALNKEHPEFRIFPLTPYWGTKDFTSFYQGLIGYTDDGYISTLNDLNHFVRENVKKNMAFFENENHRFEDSSYSTGIMIKEISGEKVFYHTGEDPGFLSLAAYIPRCNTSIVTLINQSDRQHGTVALQKIFRLAIQKACH